MTAQPAMNGETSGQDAEMVVLRKALLRVADNLSISRSELCQIIGISSATASRLYEGSRLVDPVSKEGELALLLIRVYRSLNTLMGGNIQQCQQWYRHYNHHLQGVPADLAVQIEGLVAIINYLDAMRAKV